MTQEDRLAALATRIGQWVKAALAGKADSSTVVRLTGSQQVAGTKTFSTGIGVPTPSADNHPVRHDDDRLFDERTPIDHAATHATGGPDALVPEDIGAADAAHEHTAADITDGTLEIGRLPVGVSGQSVAVGNDARFPPSGGSGGQVLTKASGSNHAMVWADPAGGGAGGTYIAGTVPAGSATVAIPHNLGTRDVVVMIRETASFQYVPVANDAPDANTVRLQFAAAPTTGQYRYVIFAALGEPTQGPIAPTAHASTHASGGTDPLTPGAIGAAETSHTHPAAALTSGILSLARLPTGTTGSTVAVGNHVHTGYAPTSHTHSGADITTGTVPVARLPVGTGSSNVARGDHTHPNMPGTLVGPYTKTSGFTTSNPGPTNRRVGGSLTVPALGFDWRPLASARLELRSDIRGPVARLELSLDDTTGAIYAEGVGDDGGRDVPWRPINASPVFHSAVLSGSTGHTFYLLARNMINAGGWVENGNGQSPHITIYAIPVTS